MERTISVMKLPILKKCFLGGGQGAALHLRFEFASFLSRRIDKPHILRYNQITFCTALHSVWNARSTVQTEQAMTLGHGAGPLNGGNRWRIMHLWDSCMFHRCVFLYLWNSSSQAGANKSNHHCCPLRQDRRIIL